MSTPWVTLTTDDLKSSMTAVEVESFGKTATDGAPDERVTQILADLVAEIRGFIGSASANTLSADATRIPPEFKARALAIARWRLLITIPRYSPGDARKAEWEQANQFFEKVATGKIRPQPADDAMPTDVPNEKPAGVDWFAAGSRTGRDRMQGL